MAWIGWTLFVLVLILHVAQLKYCHKKREHLRSYAVLLLTLKTEIYEGQRRKFLDWIRESNASDAMELHKGATDAIEAAADDFALEGDSLAGAHAALWQVKKDTS